jgi:murein DD-endopeptidase MepM/ murein hydrolase activator NlpD
MFIAGVALTGTVRASILNIFITSKEEQQQTSFSFDTVNSQTLTVLEGAKNIDPCPSKGGGDIKVVDEVAIATEGVPFGGKDLEITRSSDEIWIRTVGEGDTLSQIAEQEGVSVNTIVWANNLSSEKDIHPGDKLLILPVSGVQHTIEKGDTLKSIAKEYSGESDNYDDFIDEILEYNGLASATELVVGEVITIPGGEIKEESPSTAVYTAVVSNGPSLSGYFVNPMPGGIKTQGIHGYNAVDLSDGNWSGTTPIYAAAGGKVIVSRNGGWNGGYGNYIVIAHPNGTQTLYGHLARNLVGEGQNVAQGQHIGYEGNTGRSTGPHLHFEIRGAKNPF